MIYNHRRHVATPHHTGYEIKAVFSKPQHIMQIMIPTKFVNKFLLQKTLEKFCQVETCGSGLLG